MRPWYLLTASILLAAGCSGDDPDPGPDPVPTTTRGLPGGVSTWSGEMEIGGVALLLDVELRNEGGDLTATATFRDDPEDPAGVGTGVYTLSGTHAPESGRLALAPDDWVQEPAIALELVGFEGIYDAESRSLSGTIADYASGSDNALVGGPATLAWVSGDGEPTAIGALDAGLAVGLSSFAGSMRCTGPVREVAGSLTLDDEGALSGEMTIGDPEVASPLGTFAVTGVHNRTTGATVLVPGLWAEPVTHTVLTFFVDGRRDAATGAFTGDIRTNTAACPPATWDTSFGDD